MTQKHTPGPWAVQSMGGESRLIANGECIMCDTAYYPWTPHNDADWHLIAAAPDLLDALIEAIEYMWAHDDEYDCFDELTRARAAIAKAEGQT